MILGTRKDLVETTLWEGGHTRLVRLRGLPRRQAQITSGRAIDHVVVHASGGAPLRGVDAPWELALWDVQSPTVAHDREVGGGLGRRSIRWHYVIPAAPDVRDGRYVVYETNPQDVITAHTAPHLDTHAVSVCVAGLYESRHGTPGRQQPDPSAMVALEELVRAYLLPRFGLKRDRLLCAADCGYPANPGDHMEWRVRTWRGEMVSDVWRGAAPLPVIEAGWDNRELARPDQWVGALLALGYDAGESSHWCERAQRALLRFQAHAGIRPDGWWGPLTEAAVRRSLALLASGQWWTSAP